MARFPKTGARVEEYAAFTNAVWGSLDNFYRQWVDRWRMTIEFIRSEHWKTLQTLAEKSIPTWAEFPVVNFTGALYSDYLRQWMQTKVRFSAWPEGPESDKIAKAELADTVLANLHERLIAPVKADLGAWLLATGNASVRVYWNADTGDLLPLAIPTVDPQTQQVKLIPINPQTLLPDPTMAQPLMMDVGDIGLDVISPQLVRQPFDARHGKMVGGLYTFDDAEARFGLATAKKLSYQKAHATISADLLQLTALGSSMMVDDERALVIEHYLPKSYKNPDGLWWTCSGSQMLSAPLPLPTRGIPVISFRWIPLPGHPSLGTTPLFDVRNVNKLYSKSLKKTLEWQNKIIPKRLLTAGGGIKKGDFDDEPAQEVTFAAGAEPKYDKMPEPPAAFEQLRQETFQALQTIGLRSFRQQKEAAPGDATMKFRQPLHQLNDGDDIALAVMNSADSWKELAYILLDYVAKFYTEPRTIALVGADRVYQWREFVGSELKDFKASIHIDETSLFTWNQQSTRDAVIALLGTPAGQMLFSSPDGTPDRERVDAAMDASGLEKGFQTLDPDVTEARNENYAFKTLQDPQQAPQVMEWQQDSAHLGEHYKEVKSVSFRGWPQPAQQAMQQHIAAHEKQQQDKQQAQQGQMMLQEKSLRDIRAIAESAGDTRSELGKALVQALVSALTGIDEAKKTPASGGK
jgi:hypothetical protein